MDQRNGDFTAQGNVNSSRLPDKDQKKNSEMLSGDEPLQAQAAKMDSKNRNRLVHYEGNVLMWQGAGWFPAKPRESRDNAWLNQVEAVEERGDLGLAAHSERDAAQL